MSSENKSAVHISGTQWAIAAHIAPLAGFIIPFFNVIAPFIILKILKPEETFAKSHAAASTNFQILITAGATAMAFILFIINIFLKDILRSSTAMANIFMIFYVLILIVSLAVAAGALILMALNAIKASKNEAPKYRYTLNIIK